MSCANCHLLRNEIFQLKTTMSHCFDKVFARFDEQDAQFANLANLLGLKLQKDTGGVQSIVQSKPIPVFTESIQIMEPCGSGIINKIPFGSVMLSTIPCRPTGTVSVGSSVPVTSLCKETVNNTIPTVKMEEDKVDYSSAIAVVIDDDIVKDNGWGANNMKVTPSTSGHKRSTTNSSNSRKFTPSLQQRTNWRKLDPNDPQGICPFCFKRFTRAFSVRRHINKLHAVESLGLRINAPAHQSHSNDDVGGKNTTTTVNHGGLEDSHDDDEHNGPSSSINNNDGNNCWTDEGSSKYF